MIEHQNKGRLYTLKSLAAFILLLFSIICLLAACSAATPVATQPPAATLIPPATLVPTATPLPAFTPVPTAMPGGLYVDPSLSLGPISPYVYGTNADSPSMFIPTEMRPQIKAAKLGFFAFPGGNIGDQRDIEEWELDSFVAFCREIGAEPYIHARLLNGSPEKAAALVKYANITKGYKVRYWSIGNEPNLYGKDYTTEIFNKEWRQWAEAMRAVDPSIILLGPELNQFSANLAGNPKDSAGRDWMTEFLKANGDKVNVISFHRYPFPNGAGGTAPTIDDLRNNSREWDDIIPTVRKIIRDTLNRDLPVAATEINSSWAASTGGGEASLDSHYNAIWYADVLGRIIRQGTDFAAQFDVIGEFGMIDKYNVRPMYYVFPMYARFGAERIYASSDNPAVSIYAAKRADGALTLMVINLGSQATEIKLMLKNSSSANAETWLFDKDHAAVAVAPTALSATTNLKLTPESATLLIVPAR
jgi:hypothetical protein